jgi:plastocyanin|tara:strand:+ start:13409 stop:14032 length:624 start_codon:yes stop_codon:yes gene_type:complete
LGEVIAGELQVQLAGSDGEPVPFAVLTVPDAKAMPVVAQNGATVDQRERRFDPLVTTITPGTQVTFPNSDDTRHHVYSFSPGNAFELKLFRANDAPPVAFNAPGVVTLGCNIHDSMKAYLYVSTNPSAVVTDAEGSATLRWEGTATAIEVWHPQLSAPLQFPLPMDGAVTLALELPMAWQDPQGSKSDSELENMLKRFSRDANQLSQ